MTDADIPDFNLGIKSHLLIYEGDQDEFSSSGDEIIQNIMETSEGEAEADNENKVDESRFKSTTAEERDMLLSEAEAKNTKRSTKAHVKIFKEIMFLPSINEIVITLCILWVKTKSGRLSFK